MVASARAHYSGHPHSKGYKGGLSESKIGRTAATPAKKPGGQYVPSFLPPSMAAAMAASKVEAATAPKPQETVFPLPQTSRGSARKPRNIDLMLENLKRWVCMNSAGSPDAGPHDGHPKQQIASRQGAKAKAKGAHLLHELAAWDVVCSCVGAVLPSAI